MKDKLLETSNELLVLLKESIIAAKEMGIEQLPELAQQYIHWGIASHGFLFFITFVFLIPMIIMFFQKN